MDTEPNEAKRGGRRFRLLFPIDSGGTAKVYLARSAESEELCVVKQLRAIVENDEVKRARFLREAELSSQLEHPNIAKTIDTGLQDGQLYIAMELVHGRTLRQILAQLHETEEKLLEDTAVAIACSTLDALEYAHRLSDAEGAPLEVVHRDISPSNIMISYDGVPKLIDFGIAKSKNAAPLTQPGLVVGTTRYLSPEQVLGENVDSRSDLYSLGVVLYETVTGKRLVASDDPKQAFRAIVDEPPPAVEGGNSKLAAVIEKALQKKPDDRWQDAAAFRSALLESVGQLDASSVVRDFMAARFTAEAKETRSLLESFSEPQEDRVTRTLVFGDLGVEMEEGDLTTLLPPVVPTPMTDSDGATQATQPRLGDPNQIPRKAPGNRGRRRTESRTVGVLAIAAVAAVLGLMFIAFEAGKRSAREDFGSLQSAAPHPAAIAKPRSAPDALEEAKAPARDKPEHTKRPTRRPTQKNKKAAEAAESEPAPAPDPKRVRELQRLEKLVESTLLGQRPSRKEFDRAAAALAAAIERDIESPDRENMLGYIESSRRNLNPESLKSMLRRYRKLTTPGSIDDL